MNLMSNKWLLRFWANGEGIACGLSGRSWRVDVRVSIRNAWIGVRYTTFGPLSPSRAVTVQPLPCIGVVICWRPAAEAQSRGELGRGP